MTYTASEMRQKADQSAETAGRIRQYAGHAHRPLRTIEEIALRSAALHDEAAQMLRQAADAMEAIRDHVDAADACVRGDDDVAAMFKFAETDQRMRRLAAMQDKGQG